MKKSILFLLCLIFSFSVYAAAEDKTLYYSWLDKDKEIYVLQNRKFRKDGRVYIGFNGVKTTSGVFVDSYGVSGRAGYFFTEDWGFEIAAGKNTGQINNTARGVQEQGAVPYYRKIDSYLAAMAMWSPFYSKINTFNKIFYYDWMFGFGLANIKTLDNRNAFDTGSADADKLTSQNNMGVIWNTGLRFYVNENWSVRLDFTGLHYQATRSRENSTNEDLSAKTLFSNYDLGIGLNYSF
ncbi:MAG: outer membrane beta-barrel domain-containing protein [Bacteriovoracaceae bacterium]